MEKQDLVFLLEPSIILLILAANVAVGVITETNAEKALEELEAIFYSELQFAEIVLNFW